MEPPDGGGIRYAASFNELAREGKDDLVRYRAKEIVRLLGERCRIQVVRLWVM